MHQLKTEMTSTTKKLDITTLDGCFKGLDHFLVNFSIGPSKQNLYEALKQSSEFPESGDRRYYRRSALGLFARHCHLWKKSLVQDSKVWLVNLRNWARSTNADVIFFLFLFALE